MPEVGQDVEPEVVPLPQNPQLLNLGTTRAAWGLCLRPGVSKTFKILHLFSLRYLSLNF